MNLSRPKILTLRELQKQSNNKLQETYKIEKYKAQVELAVLELQEAFKEYEKIPEKHPMYSEEWKAFWSRLYKQLVSEGKDANSYDYKPEWFNFWTKRMDEIHKLDIDKKKESFRKKLGLSIDTISNIEASSQTIRSRSSINYETPSNSEDVVEISDDELIEPRKKRFRSGFSRCSEERFHSERTQKSPEDGPINLVSVCRLLSALESELGLMAKPVIDLLAKAVATEKSEPNSAENLLFDEDNSNILETVKEKLKGVLTANLISSNKVVAVKRAVQNIAILLHEVSLKRIKETSTNGQKKSTSVDPVTDAKRKIVEAIAENLASEGRANISEDELEALVESFLTESADVEEGVPVVKAKTSVEIVTDEDLQTLLINFDELHSDEQSNLITYLAKIEQANPARAERLRKYVNIGDADFEDKKEDTDRF